MKISENTSVAEALDAINFHNHSNLGEQIPNDGIADGAVDEFKLADEAVTTDKLRDEAITRDKIENKTITRDKLHDSVFDSLDLNRKLKDSYIVEGMGLSKVGKKTVKVAAGSVIIDGEYKTLHKDVTLDIGNNESGLICAFPSEVDEPEIRLVKFRYPKATTKTVGRWIFDNRGDNDVTVEDLVGSNHLTIYGGVVLQDDGFLSKGLRLNGSNGYIAAKSTTDYVFGNVAQEFNIIFRINNQYGTGTNTKQCQVFSIGASNLVNGLGLWVYNGYFYIGGGCNQATGIEAESGTLYFCTVQFDGCHLRLFVNGTKIYEILQTDFNLTTSSFAALAIGKYAISDSYYAPMDIYYADYRMGNSTKKEVLDQCLEAGFITEYTTHYSTLDQPDGWIDFKISGNNQATFNGTLLYLGTHSTNVSPKAAVTVRGQTCDDTLGYQANIYNGWAASSAPFFTLAEEFAVVGYICPLSIAGGSTRTTPSSFLSITNNGSNLNGHTFGVSNDGVTESPWMRDSIKKTRYVARTTEALEKLKPNEYRFYAFVCRDGVLSIYVNDLKNPIDSFTYSRSSSELVKTMFYVNNEPEEGHSIDANVQYIGVYNGEVSMDDIRRLKKGLERQVSRSTLDISEESCMPLGIVRAATDNIEWLDKEILKEVIVDNTSEIKEVVSKVDIFTEQEVLSKTLGSNITVTGSTAGNWANNTVEVGVAVDTSGSSKTVVCVSSSVSVTGLTQVTGLAAGTYTIQELLQKLVVLSHGHGTCTASGSSSHYNANCSSSSH